MLKRVLAIIICIGLLFVMCSCSSEESSDDDNPFGVFGDGMVVRYAIIYFPDGSTVSGKIDHWTYFNHSPIMHVTIDGVKYVTDSENVYLSSEVFE